MKPDETSAEKVPHCYLYSRISQKMRSAVNSCVTV